MSASSSENHAKRLARLAAVQGLYQIALTQRSGKDIIQDFQDYPSALIQEAGEGTELPPIDYQVFKDIVLGVEQNTNAIDEMIAGSCDAKISVERIEILLRAILRAGAYELHYHGSIPSGIILNDYVDITRSFFGAKEPGLVNAVLDRLAKNLRPA